MRVFSWKPAKVLIYLIITAGLPEGTVTLHDAHVNKTVYVPAKHLADVLRVFATLMRLRLTTVTSCNQLKVRHAASC